MDLVGGFKNHLDQLVAAGSLDSETAHHEGTRDYLTAALHKSSVPFHPVADLVQPIDPSRDCRALRNIVRLIRATRPDLIHTHTSKAGILGRLAARITGVPSVFTAHTWSFAEGNSRKWKLVGVPSERLAGAWANRIINVSDANRRLAIEKRVASQEKLVTVHNGIADDGQRADPGLSNPVTLAMVARFSPQKDHMTLVRALVGIRTPFRLLLVGEGPTLPAVQAEVGRLGLKDRVDFCGARHDVAGILARSQVFVLTSNAEGFPITILEAMRAGLPVVATDTGGTGEAVTHDNSGLLVPVRDVKAVEVALARLLDDPALRIRMGIAGRLRYEKEFGLPTMLRKTLTVYETALRIEAARNPRLNSHATRLAGLIGTWGAQEHEAEAV
jgi:glycosyltransferase involved in cell wall biosynthesis